MRARAIREGSVGLLILVGVALFGGLVLWLRGLRPGGQNYNVTAAFESTLGMQVGTAVRYRGVPIGRVLDIQPNSNMVDVLIEITQPDLRIPADARIEANQSGFIGETTIDITPANELTDSQQAISPTGSDCASDIIFCDGDRLDGTVGVSYESLLRSSKALADTLADPDLVDNFQATLENAAVLAERTTTLTEQLGELTDTIQAEVPSLSASARRVADSTVAAAQNASVAAQDASAAAQEFQLTSVEARSLLEANRFNLNNTLDNISLSSDRLASLLGALDSEATAIEGSQFLDNLEILSANAAEASYSLRDISSDLGDITGTVNRPENLLLITQTLDSARDVFQSAQKVLSDLDELTGDPGVRNNIRDLINGLSSLVSSTQVLEQQTELAGVLAPLSTMMPTASSAAAPSSANNRALTSADYQKLQTQLEALSALSQPSTD